MDDLYTFVYDRAVPELRKKCASLGVQSQHTSVETVSASQEDMLGSPLRQQILQAVSLSVDENRQAEIAAYG